MAVAIEARPLPIGDIFPISPGFGGNFIAKLKAQDTQHIAKVLAAWSIRR
jgi:hypothetical protein